MAETKMNHDEFVKRIVEITKTDEYKHLSQEKRGKVAKEVNEACRTIKILN